MELLAVLAATGLACWPLVVGTGPRWSRLTLAVAVLLVAMLASGALRERERTRAAVTSAHTAPLPRQVSDGGYVSSDACRACHPAQYATWHATYHRTMTQPASPQTVAAPFDGVTLTARSQNYRLHRQPRRMKRTATAQQSDPADPLVERHLRVGWRTVLVFATLGLILEGLHGFKVRWYLDVTNHTRRLMWTLAHAHGTLLGLLNVAFALTLRARRATDRRREVASFCLLAATAALPLGFFLGGLVVYGGDPGVGIVLVPIGALLLLGALALIAF
jgi:hypothetical protein